jgi:hypothetical protein
MAIRIVYRALPVWIGRKNLNNPQQLPQQRQKAFTLLETNLGHYLAVVGSL